MVRGIFCVVFANGKRTLFERNPDPSRPVPTHITLTYIYTTMARATRPGK